VLATRPRVIVVDDDAAIRQALHVLLTGEGYDVELAQAPHEAIAIASKGELDVALVDLNYTRDTTSGAEGMDLLARLVEQVPDLPVIVMTAWASLEGAVAAVRRGARDYLEKPWDSERLLRQIAALTELSQAHRYRRNVEDRQRQTRRRGLPDVVHRVAPSDAAILITGEHGTGKELVAQLVHERSKRSDGPLVALNAGAMADGVLESELFGHVRGAFTDAREDRAGCYELAHGGTLFFDELGTMPVAQQTKLLRVLETGEFRPVGSSRTRKADVRIVSATNADLIALADAGAFRHDLLYRLNTVVLRVPPLRERRQDIAVLATHFLARESRRYERSFDGFSAAARAGARGRARGAARPRCADRSGGSRARPASCAAYGRGLRRACGRVGGARWPAARGGRGAGDRASDRAVRWQCESRRRSVGVESVCAVSSIAAAAGAAVNGRSLRVRLLALLVVSSLPLGAWGLAVSLWPQMPAASWWGLGLASVVAAVLVLDRGAERFSSPLRRAANVLHALHAGDYSVRASTKDADEPLGLVLQEVNALARALHEHRQQRNESDALVRKVINATEVAFMSIDPGGNVELLNDTAGRMLAKSTGQSAESLAGRSLRDLGAGALLDGPSDAVVRDPIPGVLGRYQLRRAPFRQGGRSRTLISLSHLDRPLRAEEREASQRVIRVLGHEVNNSLAPIQTLVHAMLRRLERSEIEAETRAVLETSLATIEDRAASLQRFMSAYAKLARLPAPQLGQVDLVALVRSIVALETRVSIELSADESVVISADRDLLAQALINLLRNAAESVLQAREEGLAIEDEVADVRIEMRRGNEEIAVRVVDQGVGLATDANVFTPLFTTKKGGQGIGLVLARDIAEQHGGRVTLANRREGRGCVATLVVAA
jgi:DNA-binding NtrC family response regulator/signal transduction histidine kinase